MKIQQGTGTAIVTAHGELSLDDMRRAATAVWGEPGFARRRVLVDVRRARFTLQLGDIEELAIFTRKGTALQPPARLAFVASGDSESGQLQMYGTFRSQSGVEVKVFGDYAAAQQWVSQEAPGR